MRPCSGPAGPAQNPWRRQPPGAHTTGHPPECRQLSSRLEVVGAGRCGVAQVSRLAAASSSTAVAPARSATWRRVAVPVRMVSQALTATLSARPFEGQLGEVGQQPGVPARELDADRQGAVGGDHEHERGPRPGAPAGACGIPGATAGRERPGRGGCFAGCPARPRRCRSGWGAARSCRPGRGRRRRGPAPIVLSAMTVAPAVAMGRPWIRFAVTIG